MLWKYHYSLLDYYSIFKARASVSFSKHSLTKYKDVGWQKGKKDKQQIKFTIYEFIESQFVIFDPHLFLSSLVAVIVCNSAFVVVLIDVFQQAQRNKTGQRTSLNDTCLICLLLVHKLT